MMDDMVKAKHRPAPSGGTSRRIGLALGGGGARGLAHIVALEVFDELGLRPSAIAGSSIGAIVGAAYAAGMSGAELREYASHTFRHRSEVLGRLWRLRQTTKVRSLLAPTLGNPAQLNAERFLAAFLPEQVPFDFEDLEIPFTAVVSDFYGWKPVGLTSGDLHRSLAASMALPVLFRPVVVNGRIMIDGGVTDPLPFGFVGPDSDIVVAVDVATGPRSDQPRLPRPYESILGSMQLMMQAVVAGKLAHQPPDILIRPNISIFRVLDFLKARAIFKACDPVKDDLKRQLERALEKV